MTSPISDDHIHPTIGTGTTTGGHTHSSGTDHPHTHADVQLGPNHRQNSSKHNLRVRIGPNTVQHPTPTTTTHSQTRMERSHTTNSNTGQCVHRRHNVRRTNMVHERCQPNGTANPQRQHRRRLRPQPIPHDTPIFHKQNTHTEHHITVPTILPRQPNKSHRPRDGFPTTNNNSIWTSHTRNRHRHTHRPQCSHRHGTNRTHAPIPTNLP